MERINLDNYDTDKGHNYIKFYEAFFYPYRFSTVSVLELGMHRGGSMRIWRDYFPHGKIFGVDINPVDIPDDHRIFTYQGDATNRAFLDSIYKDHNVALFDLIIDDASHMGHDARKSFEMLFRDHLAPGGLYVVEDWGTGYMPDWPDGARYGEYDVSHQQAEGLKSKLMRRKPDTPASPSAGHGAGMVGFVKSLVDHVGGPDIRAWGGDIEDWGIEYVTYTPGLVFMKKRAG